MSRSIAYPPGAEAAALGRLLVVGLLSVALLPLGALDRTTAAAVGHLVVSEVMTGGTSANDELVELYNPTTAVLPLEGLELVYVSASGASVSRRATWGLAAPELGPGSHLLIANELGIYAGIADATYAGAMASTGGSVALRIQGAGSAIDALGWGTALGTWLEGTAASPPPAGASLERLPGGAAGSTVDTDDNAADFAVRTVPDPQNSGSPPVPDRTEPSPTPSAVPTPTPTPTLAPTPSPTAMPSVPPTATPIADARTLPDGSSVLVEGDAITGSDFADGGGYVADDSGGIAVLLAGGSFARGDRILVRGTVDDRFAQRTLRADGDDLTVIATDRGDPTPLNAPTGSVNESVEARLVRIGGTISGSPTALSGGLAFEVDDGSGATRVIVGTSTGVETAGWTNGAQVQVVGVVGQRDSSGTDASGYRVQPRDGSDVAVTASPTPTPSPQASSSPDPGHSPPPSGSVVSIADARAAAKNARITVRGVVTLPSGIIDQRSAVIQDASGAILLRLGGEAGSVARGALLEVAGVRSTKSGMHSLRVTAAPRRLGSTAEPAPRALRSGDASEASEAHLVVVRGALVASARRASSGTVSFEIDDGSGPLRIVLGAALEADHAALVGGTWLEVTGVLGQETSGAQPSRGYRVWPRGGADLRILAGATDASKAEAGAGGSGGTDGGGGAAAASLEVVGEAGLADIRVGATLVASAWPELGVGGLLWDGARLVGIAPGSEARLAPALDRRVIPLALELTGLREERERAPGGLPLVSLGEREGDTMVGAAPPHPPSATVPGPGDPPAWVSLVGRVTADKARRTIEVDGTRVAIERLCRQKGSVPDGAAMLIGIAAADPPRITVGCDGARPAPALALALGRTAIDPATPTVPAPASLDVERTATNGRRQMAAALLAFAVGAMVVAIVVGRRYRSDDAEATMTNASLVEQPPTPGPQLTLVRLPNEHGP